MKTVIIALLSLWSTFNVATAVSFLELAVPTGNFDFLNQAIQQFDIPALLVSGGIIYIGMLSFELTSRQSIPLLLGKCSRKYK